jgi:antitoxin component of MazEF toxin-antitoxin module
MVVNLQKSGDELVIVLDRKLLEEAGIDESTPVEVTASAGSITLKAVPDEERHRNLEEGLEQIHQDYGETFRRLAK